MNGFSTEEDSRDGPPAAPFYGQSCCLIDDGDRCVRPAGNASFSKRIQKSISQKKLKLDIDKSVDLFQLQVNTLRRYKRHYKLQTRPGLNKAQLAETVSRHFRNIPVNEKETLAYFIYMVKNNKSRLDQKSEGSKQLD
ncbi:histone deacetylase complex subunit SAP30L isoform X2 [Cinclus cinclus]|uniref:histone deacetylase complex subunit SAP30L isoform X2 n=1 Tax=Parus major TaxID=9157 RepID=UPI000395C04E|nr:histone deacetylase complex subunit SAP30L isoform X2 [Parus major]